MEQLDIVIIGAGVVGLATAAELSNRYPHASILLLERHSKFGQDTSSRNSEVIHAGMYYPTGSLKARLCVSGNPLLYELCRTYQIPHQQIGKIIIARDDSEIESLEKILLQGSHNGVCGLTMLTAKQVQDKEPHITAVAGLFSAHTGIIDSHKLMQCLEQQAVSQGVMLAYSNEVVDIEASAYSYAVTFQGPDGEPDTIACRYLINCAGLYADRIAGMCGIDPADAGYQIFPVKGEYFSISMPKSKLISHLIYPPPLHGLKGLGTHITKSLDGRARLGPNAHYANEREDYNVNPHHLEEFYQAASTYLPFIERHDLAPDMAGMRPKIQPPDGPAADFVICHETERGLPGLINLVGMESPALTSCLAIASYVGNMVEI